MKEIKIKYHDENMEELAKISKGDWIDLRASKIQRKVDGKKEIIDLKDGSFKYGANEEFMISFGISIELPEGHEAYVVPRSSTFKNFGIIQTNGMGIIDESYCGEGDIWMQPVFSLKPGEIHLHDRTGQFRINEKMQIKLTKVDKLDNENRGGIGSTGKNEYK